MGVDGIFWDFLPNQEKICGLEIFQILNWIQGYPQKKIRKLDVDAFSEEGKRFNSKIRLIVISRDC